MEANLGGLSSTGSYAEIYGRAKGSRTADFALPSNSTTERPPEFFRKIVGGYEILPEREWSQDAVYKNSPRLGLAPKRPPR